MNSFCILHVLIPAERKREQGPNDSHKRENWVYACIVVKDTSLCDRSALQQYILVNKNPQVPVNQNFLS